MKHLLRSGPLPVFGFFLTSLGLFFEPERGVAQGNTNEPTDVRIATIQGLVEISPAGATTWIQIQTPQPIHAFDRLRTGPHSKLTLLWTDRSVVPFDSLTELEILPPESGQAIPGLHLIRGILSFFHRDKPSRIRIITRGAVAGIEGTEFVMKAEDLAPSERTTLSVIDGRVRFGNQFGELVVTNGREAVIELGQAPAFTAGFVTRNLLQWCFYYPGVLDPNELALSTDEQTALSGSLAAYREGDLLAALALYPTNRASVSPRETIYHAALLLGAAQVGETEKELGRLETRGDNRIDRLSSALRTLIAAVKTEDIPTQSEPRFTTELLARSYYEQSKAIRESSLQNALNLAKRAVTNSPQSGFAWERVAELEFSFGRTGRALESLNRALELSPRNAQALSLKGFLLAAQNRPKQAIEWFNRAIAVDPSLGNAWLGRGLCRIRLGDSKAGREDLLIAAATEPQRAALRSYLGKAYAQTWDFKHADKELAIAKDLDSNDPTAWLYSALLKQQENRVNEAIRDLEKSQELNNNRRVYRSSLMLDQDRAVRSAELARLYADADMPDVAVREGGRAIVDDYANYSAHLFLANSFEAQRRSSISDLRFEVPAVSEYLLANLLGPANGRMLVQPVSQLEYSGLFEQNSLGLVANTEYFSRGAWRHSSAQYGTFGSSSYSLEADYFREPGERPNQDLEIRQLEAKLKQDITADDSVLFDIVDLRENGGNILQSFDAIPTLSRFDEKQAPSVFAGYHHQWTPENHTLLLAGRFHDSSEFVDPANYIFAADLGGGVTNGIVPIPVKDQYSRELTLYSVEAQQVARLRAHTIIAGARFQWSDAEANQNISDPNGPFLIILGTNRPISLQRVEASSFTASGYLYDYWKWTESFQVVGGLNYAHESFPANTISAPITSAEQSRDALLPKAGFIWSPSPSSSVRGAYTRSLTGYDLGQSFRIEPTEVAGLLQTFRDPIPVALAGGLDAVDMETGGLVLEHHFADTYLSAGYEYLAGRKTREDGIYFSDTSFDYTASPTFGLIRRKFDFLEHAAEFSMHQLIGNGFSLNARYRLAYDELTQSFPEYPASLFLGAPYGIPQRSRSRALLNTLNLSAIYRHPSGVFARVEGLFNSQWRESRIEDMDGTHGGTLPSDQFWQLNLFAGYRFPRQHAEIAIGLLNATGVNYRLDPLNQYSELPRSRTFYTRLLINF